MKFKDIIGKRIAVHCDTKKKSDAFLKVCEKMGLMFFDGGFNSWNFYKNKTCYQTTNNIVDYEDLLYYSNLGFSIVEFDEIVFED